VGSPSASPWLWPWLSHQQRSRSRLGRPRTLLSGGGSTGGLYSNIAVDARSDPSGGNPSGTVSFVVFGTLTLGRPVTCLAVTETVAVIGFNDTVGGFGPSQALVIDGAGTGLPDVFGAVPTTDDCSSRADMPLETLATSSMMRRR
jgi:hypothetical protein